MKVENIYTSIACNRTTESADWGENNLIIFGACNAVAVFDPNYNASAKIIKTFTGHRSRVNTVKWIKNKKQFLSGSDDYYCIFWNIEDEQQPVKKFLKCNGNVSVVEGIYVNHDLIVATASSDSNIKFWHKNSNSNEFDCFQTISLWSGFCFAIKMCYISQTDCLLIALATDDYNVHLYGSIKSSDGRRFVKVETLAGHEDWVRSLDFAVSDDGDILLASSSQDTFIRLWRISPRGDVCNVKAVSELQPTEEIKIEERIFTIESEKRKQCNFAITLESVLLGHDGWVYGVNWSRQVDGSLQLLSSSIDKTLIIWATTDDGVWMEKIRVGDVGGNSLGFYGGKFSPDGQSIIGHSFHGSFHIWRQSREDTSSWLPGIVVGGHYGNVQDLAWEPSGLFLITLSTDQTTRIHAPWVRSSDQNTWHELARPQVHGYDMKALAVLGRYRFASGAEEKIIRTFHAPGNFVENFRRICKISGEEDPDGTVIIDSSSKGASVPSLGLSNKAVFVENEAPTEQKHIKDEYPENYFSPVTLNEPPPEETLMQNTLWPEIQKLYGHGYEIVALASSCDGKFLASSCKSSNFEHSQVIVWNTNTWKQHQKLASHQLTVTQMKFSPNNQYLLTVSRDRRWTLFENINDSFERVATTDRTNGMHARIIWTCDWTHDSKYFATGSRDGKIVCWQRNNVDTNTTLRQWKHSGVLEMKDESVNALAFTKNYLHNVESQYMVAIGLEIGTIHIYGFDGSETWTPYGIIQSPLAHHRCINKMEFKPDPDKNILASCGNDNLVRLYSIQIDK